MTKISVMESNRITTPLPVPGSCLHADARATLTVGLFDQVR